MKTMKKGDSVIRVKEEEINKKLSEGYFYCPKLDWKAINSRSAKLKEKAEELKEDDTLSSKKTKK